MSINKVTIKRISLGILSIISLLSSAVGQCTDGWRYSDGACYYFSGRRDSLSFWDASNACQGRGGELTSVTQQNFRFLTQTWRILVRECYNCGDDEEKIDTWVGLYNPRPENRSTHFLQRKIGWYWLDGVTYDYLTFDKWFAGYLVTDYEPTGDAKCARMRSDGSWADKECSAHFRYICKIVIKTPAPPTTTTTTTSTTTTTPTTTTTTTTTTPPTTTTTTPKPPTTSQDAGSSALEQTTGEPTTSSAPSSPFSSSLPHQARTESFHGDGITLHDPSTSMDTGVISGQKQTDRKTAMIVGIVLGVVVLLLVICNAILLFCLCAPRRQEDESEESARKGFANAGDFSAPYNDVNNVGLHHNHNHNHKLDLAQIDMIDRGGLYYDIDDASRSPGKYPPFSPSYATIDEMQDLRNKTNLENGLHTIPEEESNGSVKPPPLRLGFKEIGKLHKGKFAAFESEKKTDMYAVPNKNKDDEIEPDYKGLHGSIVSDAGSDETEMVDNKTYT